MPSSRKTPSVFASLSRLPRLPRRFASRRFRRAAVLGGAIGFMGIGLRLPLHADTFNWLGGSAGGSTLWELFDNWDKGSVPGVNDDAVNSTSNVIDYLIGAGTSTINSFTNSGGGTFNLNLSDPLGQSFTVNGNVSNLLSTSIIDITGSNFNTVYFNNNGGLLTNEGIIRVHDTGSLYSFADDITNSGTMSAASGSLINITQTGTLINSGTISALSGGSVSVFNTSTFNDVNALMNADGSGSVLSIGSLLFTNDGTIRTTDGGSVIISDPGLTLTNNNVIQANGTGAMSAPLVRLTGDTLTNNIGGVIEAINGHDAATTLNFNTIINSGTLQATDGSLVSLNASTLTNNAGIILAGGIISAQGTDAVSGIISRVLLGDYNATINQITNAGTISAVNGGNTTVFFNTLNNSGSLLSDGTGETGSTTDPMTGEITHNFYPSTLYLVGTYSTAASDALTNTGTIAATNGGRINPIAVTSNVPFTNQGTISADGVGMSSRTKLLNGDIHVFNTESLVQLNQGSTSSPGQYIPGTLTNDVNGILSATNGGKLYASTTGGDIINNGQVKVDGLGVLERTDYHTGGYQTISYGSFLYLNSHAGEDSSGVAQGGALLNTGTMTASNGTLLYLSAENGLTNAGNIIVHGDSFGVRAHAQLYSAAYTSSSNVVTGGNIDFTGGSVLVDTWGAFSAYATTNITQAAASSITARDNITSVDLTSVGNFSNAGLIDISNKAALTLNVGGDLTNSGNIRATSGATLNGTVKGSLDNSGNLETSGGAFKTNATGGSFTNSGTLNANGGSVTAVAPTSATNSGTLTAQNGGNVTVQNSTVLNNSGTIRAGNASTLTFSGGETQVGAGSRTQVDAGGTLTVGGSGLTLGTGIVAGDGGILAGNGTVAGNVFNLSGTVDPGASPGLLSVNGNYTQGSLGKLHIQIEGLTPGTQYDVFSVNGNVFLDGLLTLDFDSAFQPMTGDTFDFLRYTGTLSGNFSTVQVLGLNNGLAYSLNAGNGGYNLVFTAAAVPEPGTVALLLGLSVAGASFLRRKRQIG